MFGNEKVPLSTPHEYLKTTEEEGYFRGDSVQMASGRTDQKERLLIRALLNPDTDTPVKHLPSHHHQAEEMQG